MRKENVQKDKKCECVLKKNAKNALPALSDGLKVLRLHPGHGRRSAQRANLKANLRWKRSVTLKGSHPDDWSIVERCERASSVLVSYVTI